MLTVADVMQVSQAQARLQACLQHSHAALKRADVACAVGQTVIEEANALDNALWAKWRLLLLFVDAFAMQPLEVVRHEAVKVGEAVLCN